MRKDSFVIVRIWTSAMNKDIPGEGVGHVSVETSTSYISLWPACPARFSNGFFNPVSPEFKIDLEEDEYAEERSPEIVIALYSLNSEAIEAEFRKASEEIKGWALVGNNLLFNGCSAENCASMAYRVLKAGGLDEVMTVQATSRFKSSHSASSIVSPDALGHAILAAKAYEHRVFPETLEWHVVNETTKLTPGGSNKGCTLM